MMSSKQFYLKRINDLWHIPNPKICDAFWIMKAREEFFGDQYIIYQNRITGKLEVAVPDYEGYVPFDRMEDLRQAKYAMVFQNQTQLKRLTEEKTFLFLCNHDREIIEVITPKQLGVPFEEYLKQSYDTDVGKIYQKKRKHRYDVSCIKD